MTTTLHRARTTHPCGSYRCDNDIAPGDLYLRHVVFPGQDSHEHGTRPATMRECYPCANSAGEWLRERYQVSAHPGNPVRFDGQLGVIVALRAGHVQVRLDEGGKVVSVHPTWRMEYLDAALAGAR
jgi:hypothetical protein